MIQNYRLNPWPNKNLLIPLNSFAPRANNKVLDTVIAVNAETATPIKNTKAKPFTSAEVAVKNNINAVIILDKLLSLIDSQARLNPSLIPSSTEFLFSNSSRMRSNIKILPSTAIPIDIINAAKPADVNTTPNNLNKARLNII